MRIKAKIQGISKYQTSPKETKVVLPISVGQDYHEGEKFVATLEMIEKRFAACDIIICDILQRYNFSPEYTLEQSIQQVELEGTKWIERNMKYINNANIPIKIIRWKECLEFWGFKLALENIKNLFHEDSSLQLALKADIQKFIDRDQARSINEIESACTNYLFEEAAVFISFFYEKKYDYVVYPSVIPKFIQQCREKFLSKTSTDCLYDLKIYFKKTGKEITV